MAYGIGRFYVHDYPTQSYWSGQWHSGSENRRITWLNNITSLILCHYLWQEYSLIHSQMAAYPQKITQRAWLMCTKISKRLMGSVEFAPMPIWHKPAENHTITFSKWEPQHYIRHVRTAGLHSACKNHTITFSKREPQDYIRHVRTAGLHSASENRRITFGK